MFRITGKKQSKQAAFGRLFLSFCFVLFVLRTASLFQRNQINWRQPNPSLWSATPIQSISQFKALLNMVCASSGVLFF
jgi:hypothetical protein